MSIRQYVMSLILICTGVTTAYGQCLVQETTIMHINGVNVKQSEAKRSTDRIRDELFAQPEVNPECIAYITLYNTSTALSLDLAEAGIQKAQELGRELSDFWKVYLRIAASMTDHQFLGVIGSWYVATDFANYVIDEQLQEHIRLVREELSQGRSVILVPHSQGNLYANALWDALTFDEQSQVHIVSVATPSDSVAGDGQYTTLQEDDFASLFLLALPANAANTEICPNGWYCHGFKEWYLTGNNSRSRIIDDITALLPKLPTSCLIEGTIRSPLLFTPIAGATIVLQGTYASAMALGTYTADSNGHYCIPQGATPYNWNYLVFFSGGDRLGGQSVYVVNDTTTFVDYPPPVMF